VSNYCIREDIRKKVGSTNATNFVDYLREFEAIFEKALTCVSGNQGKLFDEKNRGLVSGSL
jgi:hypothetical protein